MEISALLTNRGSGKSTISKILYDLYKSSDETLLFTFNKSNYSNDDNIIDVRKNKLNNKYRNIKMIILDDYCNYFKDRSFLKIFNELKQCFTSETEIIIVSTPNKTYLKEIFNKIVRYKRENIRLSDDEINDLEYSDLYLSLLTEPNVKFIDNQDYLNKDIMNKDNSYLCFERINTEIYGKFLI